MRGVAILLAATREGEEDRRRGRRGFYQEVRGCALRGPLFLS